MLKLLGNISLYKKLVGGGILMAVMPLVVGVVFFWGLGSLSSSMGEVIDVSLPSVDSVRTVAKEFESIRTVQRNLLNPHITKEVFLRQFANLDKARASYQGAWKKYEAIPKNGEEAKVWTDFVALVGEWKKENNVYFELARQYGKKMEPFFNDPLSGGMSYYEAMQKADNTAMRAFVSFKLQVQEWKNILLRGADKESYEKYLKAFESNEKEVREKLESLKPLIKAAGLDQVRIDEIMGLHAELGTKYRNALKAHDPSEQDFNKTVDKMLKGADRPLDEAFNKMVSVIDGEVKEVEDLRGSMAKQIYEVCRPKEMASISFIEKIISFNAEKAEKAAKRARKNAVISKTVSGIGVFCGFVFSLFFGLSLAMSITRPVKKTISVVHLMEKGDMSQRVEIMNRDEIGSLAAAMNSMADNLGSIIKNLDTKTIALENASANLSGISGNMADGANEAARIAESVAAAAEEMNASASGVAAGMDSASDRLGSVAGATEEMSATIHEIAVSAEKARKITDDARTKAVSISDYMKTLGEAAKDIGQVTEVITDISGQTNLLALNATIEASRAGEAGRGFAVVANEIKELARQTSTATDEIRQKINGVQSSTDTVVESIANVASIISETSDIVSSIASAIEEQSAATREIASNINNVAKNVYDANTSVSQMASVSGEIARDISRVDMASKNISQGIKTIISSSDHLSDMSGELKRIVESFKV